MKTVYTKLGCGHWNVCSTYPDSYSHTVVKDDWDLCGICRQAARGYFSCPMVQVVTHKKCGRDMMWKNPGICPDHPPATSDNCILKGPDPHVCGALRGVNYIPDWVKRMGNNL